MTPIAGALTFMVVFLLCAVIYMPALKEHYDTYGVRVRPRKKVELEAAQAFLEEQMRSRKGGDQTVEAWADLCHAVYNAKEFLFLR